MLSQTSQYALRAMVFLAKNEAKWPIVGSQIARETEIPSRYLSSVLSNLVRAGLLSATPGPTGGFRFARPADCIRLFDVLLPFESSLLEMNGCPFGNDSCSEESPCAGHSRWKQVKESYLRFLQETTVREVSIREAALPLTCSS